SSVPTSGWVSLRPPVSKQTLYPPSGRLSNRYFPPLSVFVDASCLPVPSFSVTGTSGTPGSPVSCRPLPLRSAHTKSPRRFGGETRPASRVRFSRLPTPRVTTGVHPVSVLASESFPSSPASGLVSL